MKLNGPTAPEVVAFGARQRAAAPLALIAVALITSLLVAPERAAGQVFNFLDPPFEDVTPSVAGEWRDVDVSAYVPVGATGVIVQQVATDSWEDYGIRKNGSDDTWMSDQKTAAADQHCFLMAGLADQVSVCRDRGSYPIENDAHEWWSTPG